jgi:GABA permease
MPAPGDVRRRILVIANETAASAELAAEVRWRARGGTAEILVVAPLTAPLVGDRASTLKPEARLAEAKVRLGAALSALAGAGLNARGELGDADPMRALDQVVWQFRPDELIIATHPPDRSQWLKGNLVQRTRERYQLPTTHVVADLDRERWESEGGAVPPPRISNNPPPEV